MKFLARLVPAVFSLLALAGCYFDHPLTGCSSKDINTWLLGVWESKDDKGRVSRVMVTPASVDHYAVNLTVPGKKPGETKKYEFLAWPSKVGNTLFLSLRCQASPGDIPAGAFVFTQVQLLDQNDARTHGLNLESAQSASSYELRKEVRKKIKDRTIYEGQPSVVWTRVAEVFWSNNGGDPTFKPIRNQSGVVWRADDDAQDKTRRLFRNSFNN